MTDDQIIDEILRREGDAYTDHPADRGGPTKYGITQLTWDVYRGEALKRRYPPYSGALLPARVADIEKQHARELYRAKYVEPFLWIKNDALRGLVVDCGVNHGTHRATRWLQASAGVTQDGVIGPVTRAAVNTQPTKAYVGVLRLRFRCYADLVVADDSQIVFLRGWINRANEFIR